MSNTTNLTPYENGGLSIIGTGLGIAAACVATTAIGIVKVSKWLAEETPEDRHAIERSKERNRKERIEQWKTSSRHIEVNGRQSQITSVHLHLRDLEPLIRSAEKLGYRLESLDKTSNSKKDQKQILLQATSGERISITRNTKGRLVLSTAGDIYRIQSLVHQHTLDRTVEHLGKMGMAVQTAKLPTGEIQVLARDQNTPRIDGSADVRAQIRTDGSAWVDVDKIKGKRCEEIVTQLAQAIGAEPTGTVKKDSYFQLPGEPVKTKVRL